MGKERTVRKRDFSRGRRACDMNERERMEGSTTTSGRHMSEGFWRWCKESRGWVMRARK